MTILANQFPGDIPQVSKVAIHIPDDSSLGTGSFTTFLNPRALRGLEPFDSRIVNPSVFGISAAFNPGRGILVQIVDSDGTQPRHKLGFLFPVDLDVAASHVLVVEFANWRVVSATMDGNALATMERSGN